MNNLSSYLILFLINIIYINCASVSLYGQCGGQGYTGATTCVSGSTCYAQSIYYSQCLTSCPSGWVCVGNSHLKFDFIQFYFKISLF